ncbi:hypothetical protein LUZ61_009301 [Rhynchospora tenuis]|uniref:MULE transposase domain-containing protein n=1 Tax=Rhynchospora tenuis TaxID=198213 RepID=A0AAD6EY64_9POAL|nr:hypothetical protein LUZ61_009301 [Rhynchospora tenuis]
MDPSTEEQLISIKFETRDKLLDCVRAFYSKRGYILSILRSKAEKSVVLRCDRGGNYRNTHKISEEQRKKFTSSRLANCPFQLYGKKNEEGTWAIEIRNNEHNHGPSTDISAHASLRRLTPDQLESVEHMSNCGIRPKQILASLRHDDPDTRVIARTIYNAKKKIQKNNLQGKSAIQKLFEDLGDGRFKFNILRDEEDHITHLYVADPRSILLTRNFPNIFIMDCTYKTNRYKMPLLNIIGMTSFNTSFFSAFVFLKRERTEDYIWALRMFKETLGEVNQPLVVITDRELALINAIQDVFPSTTNILCIWHINKNILAKCKMYFQTKEDWETFSSDWQKVVYSSTEGEYIDNWREFETTYKEKNEALVYIKETWLPLKEKFVSAWTDGHLHLGNRASSRAEGAHSKLKKYLEVSTGNLQIVKKKICLAIDNEFNEITVQLAREKAQVPHACDIPYFKNLIYRISTFAFKELHEQYMMAKKGTMHPICTGKFTTTMGIPCAHKMENWRTGSLSLDQVHPHWRIDTRELNNPDSNLGADHDDQIENIIDNFRREYHKWPLDKKKRAEEIIQQITIQPDVLFEPTITSRENRFQVAKKRKAKNSTRRDPSQFEIVEARWQSNSSNGVTHARQMHQDTNIAAAEFEVPTTVSDGGVIDWIDLNM